jgi:sulfatase modifying factor 1
LRKAIKLSNFLFHHYMFRVLIIVLIVTLFSCDEKQSKNEELANCSTIDRNSLATFEKNDPKLKINAPLSLEGKPDSIPKGMVFVPGGETTIGSESGMANEQPVFTVDVQPFFMDKHPVTVGEFRSFVKETGYITFSDSIGDGIVFDFDQANWIIKPGVNWEYPLGKEFGKAPDNHPVTLITYKDATMYLEWVGKRLPTEIEWEHAARGQNNRNDRYAWGNSLKVNGEFMTNTWNGVFPVNNNVEDGHLTTAPIGIYAKNDLGLTDMGGNVWEWTSSWYRPYSERDKAYQITKNSERVLRGGSFMCHSSYCHGYRVSARSNTPADNNMFHIGFRGVKAIR